MYTLWQMSQAYSKRPSDILGIADTLDNSVLRWELDQAVNGLGQYVDNKLKLIDEKGAPRYRSVSAVLDTRRKAKADTKRPKKSPKDVGAKPASTLKRRRKHGE